MNFSLNRQQWDALGQLDPFWAMTGINKFHAWDPVAFFSDRLRSGRGIVP